MPVARVGQLLIHEVREDRLSMLKAHVGGVWLHEALLGWMLSPEVLLSRLWLQVLLGRQSLQEVLLGQALMSKVLGCSLWLHGARVDRPLMLEVLARRLRLRLRLRGGGHHSCCSPLLLGGDHHSQW